MASSSLGPCARKATTSKTTSNNKPTSKLLRKTAPIVKRKTLPRKTLPSDNSSKCSNGEVTVADALNLQEVRFGDLTVPELRKQLKSKGLSITGKKGELVERLQSSLPSPSPTEACDENVGEVGVMKCKCGDALDDRPTVQCQKCECWSHCSCYDLSIGRARSVTFVCVDCSASLGSSQCSIQGPAGGVTSSDDVETRVLDAIQEVRNQLSKFTRIFNQHLIIMRDDISDLSSNLSTRLARAEARLNVLDMAWDGHLYSRTPSSPGSFPIRNRSSFDCLTEVLRLLVIVLLVLWVPLWPSYPCLVLTDPTLCR